MISENGDSKLWLLLVASPLTCTGERNASLLVLAAVTPQSNALLHIVMCWDIAQPERGSYGS